MLSEELLFIAKNSRMKLTKVTQEIEAMKINTLWSGIFLQLLPISSSDIPSKSYNSAPPV